MRSVWIEIVIVYAILHAVISHAPCGACGLKLKSIGLLETDILVTLHAERVD